jgi:molybdopterin synthase sulfur carrier subunit
MNKISIEFFGMLVEITGKKNIMLENIGDTENLKLQINDLFPAMKKQTYMLALNNKLITNKTTILHNCNVACMPPFAGG